MQTFLYLNRMKKLIEAIVMEIVDDKASVNVSEINGEETTVLELSVAKNDLGKVIGRGGRMADAIRTIIHAAATKNKRRVVLEIIE